MKIVSKIIIILSIISYFGLTLVQAQDPFLGEIRMFAGNFAPRGWAFCDGQIMPINQYTALFSIIGTTYGGDGRTTFALPDLRGRVAIHAGRGPGLSDYLQGQTGGIENVTLTEKNLPAHNHSIPSLIVEPDNNNQEFSEGNNSVLSVGTAPNSNVKSNNSGGGQPINNIQPYGTIRYIICIQGMFPSRN